MEHRGKVMTNQQIIKFLKAGRAVFTLESLKTGKHYTFKAGKNKGVDCIWISVLTDGDKYVYLGTIFIDTQNRMSYSATAKSPKNFTLHRVMEWFITLVEADKSHPDLVFRHSGSCGACGRELTTPESLDSGLGPVCRAKA